MMLSPKYPVGILVEYQDRHGRKCEGKVRSIEGKWWEFSDPYLVYCLQHPTYRNGNFYCGEKAILRKIEEKSK